MEYPASSVHLKKNLNNSWLDTKIFGLKINRLDNPSLAEEQRRTTTFDFQEKIQMNVIGKIGDKKKDFVKYVFKLLDEINVKF